MTALWALLPRWAKFALLGAIVATGGGLWLWHRAYTAGQMAERLAADDRAIAAASQFRAEKAKAVADAYRQGAAAIRAANQLHDSVRVVDTVTVELSLPPLPGSLVPLRQTVTVPAIIVRRIVSDSLSLRAKDRIIATQADQIVADSALISAQAAENKDLRAMKAPSCGLKCKVAVSLVKVAIVGEVAVRVAQALKPRR
jgi:hypothetical protein